MLLNKDIILNVKKLYDKFGFDYTEGYFNGSIEFVKLLNSLGTIDDKISTEKLVFLQQCLDALFAIENGDRETLINIKVLN